MHLAPNPDERFELRQVACAHGRIAWREAGQGLPLILLHGIGSGSGAWSGQLEGLSSTFRVIAWDAPGYGGSDPLHDPTPLATDYAQVLADFVHQLGLTEAIVLGHSLGALVAAAWAAQPTLHVRALVLASPARGYGQATPELRATKFRERAELVARLGIDGLAEQRSAGLCAPGASAGVLAQVRRHMARATASGYLQAAHMLANDDLLTHLHHVKAPVSVLCGELDRVTPLDACASVAHAVGAPYVPLRHVAHACYLEDPVQFNDALLALVRPVFGAAHV
jgi:pimeloyl-ACP methyl ester carboxylesterase